MIYAYRCRQCGSAYESQIRGDGVGCQCGGTARRDFSSVQLGRPSFTPHFNHAVGEYVSSSRQFDDVLKLRAEQAGSEFTRLDPGDVPRPTRDDAVFEVQEKAWRDGKPPDEKVKVFG